MRSCLMLLCLASASLWTFASANAEVLTFAGTGKKGFSGDGGKATDANLNNVYAVARGPDGWLYLCDMDNHRIRRINRDGIIETFAGSDERGYAGDGGQAKEAKLNQPYELTWDRSGNLFFVEVGNHCVRRVDAETSVITTVAGTGKAGFSGDNGPATQAQFNQPHSLAFDASGHLFVCDVLNHRVRKIDLGTGIITTWAGTGERKTASDGSSIHGSQLHGPRAIAFARDGKCWLALREGNAVLLLDPSANTIKRIAGTGKSGFTGNGGPAIHATLSGPKAVSLDADGNVYLADTESHTIRYIDVKKGTLELLVGDGQRGDGPDSRHSVSNDTCRLARPHGVFVDVDGSVYIGDSENHRVRVFRPDH